VNAVLGAAVIVTVSNGMDLLGYSSGVKFIVTGTVLLAAVLVDSFAKRARAASGVA
jgi:D-xylose transport system permease protein